MGRSGSGFITDEGMQRPGELMLAGPSLVVELSYALVRLKRLERSARPSMSAMKPRTP
jgi:hypothetical protein